MDLFIAEGLPPGRHGRGFFDRRSSLLDDLEHRPIRHPGDELFIRVVTGLGIEGGGRGTIPPARGAMADGAKLPIFLLTTLHIGLSSTRGESRAKQHRKKAGRPGTVKAQEPFFSTCYGMDVQLPHFVAARKVNPGRRHREAAHLRRRLRIAPSSRGPNRRQLSPPR